MGKCTTKPGASKVSDDLWESIKKSGIRLGDLATLEWFIDKMYDCRANCESPIEEQMLEALIYIGRKMRYSLRVDVDGDLGWQDGDRGNMDFDIHIQQTIKPYRVDFLVEKIDYVGDLENTRFSTKKIVVECDGHDFHERTKEQAKKDKKRDRDLQKAGYLVMRFTGSEIFADAVGCAYEALGEKKEEWE